MDQNRVTCSMLHLKDGTTDLPGQIRTHREVSMVHMTGSRWSWENDGDRRICCCLGEPQKIPAHSDAR